MEDRFTIENIKKQVVDLQKNNTKYIEAIAGIEMLLNSNNNGKVKDQDITKKYNELKKKVNELNDMTSEFISMLD